MNSKLKWILILCGLVILIGGAYIAYDKLAPMVEDMRGREENNVSSEVSDETLTETDESANKPTVPPVALYDAEGNSVSLPDLIDKPTILNFWASTCNPCASEMPHFQAVYEELGDEYNFIFINF